MTTRTGKKTGGKTPAKGKTRASKRVEKTEKPQPRSERAQARANKAARAERTRLMLIAGKHLQMAASHLEKQATFKHNHDLDWSAAKKELKALQAEYRKYSAGKSRSEDFDWVAFREKVDKFDVELHQPIITRMTEQIIRMVDTVKGDELDEKDVDQQYQDAIKADHPIQTIGMLNTLRKVLERGGAHDPEARRREVGERLGRMGEVAQFHRRRRA